jgi:putative radical SAM enzyme (TIGR03279 family)
MSQSGLLVTSVKPGSPAFTAGLRTGDTVVSVDGSRVSDTLEFGFFSAQSETEIRALRDGEETIHIMLRPSGAEPGVRFKAPPVMQCGNKCIFCFIDQMPPGLRKSLYVKDEDYRHSFTNGNYVTLSHTPQSRLMRIAQLGLSPLFISVHATDQTVRRQLLGNKAALDIMQQLRLLEKHNIRVHTQIVVCPGINDGAVLKKTIQDLLTLKEGLLSIAVVPVGLTRHRSIALQPVTKSHAMAICREVGDISDKRAAKDGIRRIFCADELFIKAGISIPPKKYYEEYPQIENGVGLIRQLLEEWQEIRKGLIRQGGVIQSKKASGRFLVVTSMSAYSFIRKIFDELQKLKTPGTIDVSAVRNLFFGESVTVAGLMSAADVIRTVKAAISEKTARFEYRYVFLPAVMFNTHGHTLDGYSRQRIEKTLGLRVKVVCTTKEVVEYVLGK